MNGRRGLLLLAVAGVLTGCGSGGEQAAPAVTVTVTSAVPTVVTPPPTTPAVTPPPTAQPPVASPSTTQAPVAPPPVAPTSFVMPNEIGKDLQSAQDDIQSASGNPIFVSHSHDASGRGRFQILDRDWTVCSQNIAPGSALTEDTNIDFGVVKISERC